MITIKLIAEDDVKSLLLKVKSDFNDYKSCYHNHSIIEDFKPLTDGLRKIETGGFVLDQTYFDSKSQLKLITDNSSNYDFENSKIIYTAFAGQMDPLKANDPRLWVRLTHDHGHKYVVRRWMESSGEKKFDTVKERFFFEGASQTARMRNGLSRLWWLAHLTIDHNAENDEEKWRFTKAVCESQDFITSLFERTMGTYREVRFGILEFYIENPHLFSGNKSKKIQLLAKQINNYGGVSLLPMLSREKVKFICLEILNELDGI